jgi:hypothetical protein
MYSMCTFTKKSICLFVLIIWYLESITQALRAYFGRDSRECECLEFFLLINYVLSKQ